MVSDAVQDAAQAAHDVGLAARLGGSTVGELAPAGLTAADALRRRRDA